MDRVCSSRSVAVASVLSILIRVCICLKRITNFISNMQRKNRLFFICLTQFCTCFAPWAVQNESYEGAFCRSWCSVTSIPECLWWQYFYIFLYFSLITVSMLKIKRLYLFPSSSAFSSFLTSSTPSSSLCFLWPASTWERTASNSSFSSFIFDPRELFCSSASFSRFSISEISALRASVFFSAALVWINLK